MDTDDPVVVDGIPMRGAFATVGHSTVEKLERAFLDQASTYPEHGAAVHWRWSYILEHVPQMRGRHLHHDLTDVYTWAEKQPASNALWAVYDLAILQSRFYSLLTQNCMSGPATSAWMACTTQAWQRRLLERIEHQEPWRRNARGKVRAPRSTEPLKVGKWYN